MMGRGRPRLDEAERERRRAISSAWAAEIKKHARLSSSKLEEALAYGDGGGRTWRALMAGMRFPAPATFKRISSLAAQKGWLGPFGILRYSEYWNPENDESDGYTDIFSSELQWRNGVFGRVMLMLMAHARQCGIEQCDFFSDARSELEQMEAFMANLDDAEILRRARRVASFTIQELKNGPEWPITSLIQEG